MGVIERRKKIKDVGYLLDPFIDDIASEGDIADRRSKEVEAI